MLYLYLQDGNSYGPFDCIINATGRTPQLSSLRLEGLGIQINNKYISVDEYQNTNIKGIYAVGDCCGKVSKTYNIYTYIIILPFFLPYTTIQYQYIHECMQYIHACMQLHACKYCMKCRRIALGWLYIFVIV